MFIYVLWPVAMFMIMVSTCSCCREFFIESQLNCPIIERVIAWIKIKMEDSDDLIISIVFIELHTKAGRLELLAVERWIGKIV